MKISPSYLLASRWRLRGAQELDEDKGDNFLSVSLGGKKKKNAPDTYLGHGELQLQADVGEEHRQRGHDGGQKQQGRAHALDEPVLLYQLPLLPSQVWGYRRDPQK